MPCLTFRLRLPGSPRVRSKVVGGLQERSAPTAALRGLPLAQALRGQAKPAPYGARS